MIVDEVQTLPYRLFNQSTIWEAKGKENHINIFMLEAVMIYI